MGVRRAIRDRARAAQRATSAGSPPSRYTDPRGNKMIAQQAPRDTQRGDQLPVIPETLVTDPTDPRCGRYVDHARAAVVDSLIARTPEPDRAKMSASRKSSGERCLGRILCLTTEASMTI